MDFNEIVDRAAEATTTSPEQVRGALLGLAVLVAFYALKAGTGLAVRLSRAAARAVAARRARVPDTTEAGRRITAVLADRDPDAVARWIRVDASGNTYAATVPVGERRDGRPHFTKFSVHLGGHLADARGVAVTVEGVDVRLLTAADGAAVRAAGHALFLVLTQRDTLAQLPVPAADKVACPDACCPPSPTGDKVDAQSTGPKKTPADQVREFFADLGVSGQSPQAWLDAAPGMREPVGGDLTVFRTGRGLVAYRHGNYVRTIEFDG